MYKTIATFLIVITIAFGATTLFLNKNAEAEGDFTQTTSTESDTASRLSNQLAHLQTLNRKINENVFLSPIFKSLEDFSQDIAPADEGRDNPFAPIQ